MEKMTKRQELEIKLEDSKRMKEHWKQKYDEYLAENLKIIRNFVSIVMFEIPVEIDFRPQNRAEINYLKYQVIIEKIEKELENCSE